MPREVEKERHSRGLSDRLLTPDEAAELLAVPVRMLRRLREQGRIGYIKIGRYVRFSVDQVEAYVKEHEIPVRRKGR